MGVVVLVGGCGGAEDRPTLADKATVTTSSSAAGDSGTDALDACSLVTEAEAEAVVGSPMQRNRGGTPGVANNRVCTYFVEGSPREGFVLSFTDESAGTQYDALEKSFGDDAREIDDLGDRALWSERVSTLITTKGDRFLLVQFIGVDSLAPREPKAVSIVRAALARL